MEHAVQPFFSRPLHPAETEGRRRVDEVRQLLDQAAELDLELSREPRAREEIGARRAAVAASLLHLLQSWRRRGGEVRLDPPTEVITRAPRPVVVPDSGEVLAHLERILAGLVPIADDVADLDRVHAAIRDSARWAFLPRELRRGVVALCTTRLRHLQDDRRITHPRLEEAFAMLTAYSKREQPGFVVGLSRSHRPVRGTWAEDAAGWYERLCSHAQGRQEEDVERAELSDPRALSRDPGPEGPPEAR